MARDGRKPPGEGAPAIARSRGKSRLPASVQREDRAWPGDAGLAADADILVEIDDAIRAAVHGRGWTSGDTGRVIALVAAGDLKGAAGGGELSDVDVLDVRAIHAEGNGVLRLTGSAAGVTADAAGLVDDLSPLHRFGHGGKVSRANQTSVCKTNSPGILCIPGPFSTRWQPQRGIRAKFFRLGDSSLHRCPVSAP